MADCSVVIPLFNGAAWIIETLRSVLAQSIRPTDVLVVDDGSTDDSARRVLSFPGVQLLRNQGKGAVAARNLGLRLARAPFVAFLDQDDLWHPRHLQILSGLLEAQPDIAAAVAGAVRFEGTAPPWRDVNAVRATWFDPWSTYPFDSPVDCPSQVLTRRAKVLGLGGWEPRFSGVADLHLWLRLSTRGPLAAIQDATVGRRVHGESNFSRLLLDPVPLLQRRCAALLAAGRERLRALPHGAPRRNLARRMRLLARATSLASAAGTPSGPMGPALARLAALTTSGDEAAWHQVIRYLIFWMCIGGEPASFPGRRSTLLGALRDAWPPEERVGRAVLERYLAGMVRA